MYKIVLVKIKNKYFDFDKITIFLAIGIVFMLTKSSRLGKNPK